jgi:hypothetical protein
MICRMLIVQKLSLKSLHWTDTGDKLDCPIVELKLPDFLPCLHTCILLAESTISAQKLLSAWFSIEAEVD